MDHYLQKAKDDAEDNLIIYCILLCFIIYMIFILLVLYVCLHNRIFFLCVLNYSILFLFIIEIEYSDYPKYFK